MAIEWTTAEQTIGGVGLPMKVKVAGVTGGAYALSYHNGNPTLIWCPNSEGVLNFLVLIGAFTHVVEISQEAFDEITDNTKDVYLSVIGSP